MCIDLKDNMLKCESSNMQVPFLGEGDIPKRKSTLYTRRVSLINSHATPPNSTKAQDAEPFRALEREQMQDIHVAGRAMCVHIAGHPRGVRVNSSLQTSAGSLF